MTPKVVLVGLPGSGKSSSGRRLAKILAVEFADSDELVEAADGRSVATIFTESGEAAFRAAEASAVENALCDFGGVLALGGGAVNSGRTRSVLARSRVPVVQLRASLTTLVTRVGDARTRPVLGTDPAARLAQLADERGSVYAELAAFGVDTDGRSPGQVAATIAARLHDRSPR